MHSFACCGCFFFEFWLHLARKIKFYTRSAEKFPTKPKWPGSRAMT